MRRERRSEPVAGNHRSREEGSLERDDAEVLVFRSVEEAERVCEQLVPLCGGNGGAEVDAIGDAQTLSEGFELGKVLNVLGDFLVVSTSDNEGEALGTIEGILLEEGESLESEVDVLLPLEAIQGEEGESRPEDSVS